MKIRVGFVSNSSSSSFCVMYANVSKSLVLEKQLELLEKDFQYITEGYDYHDVTRDIAEFSEPYNSETVEVCFDIDYNNLDKILEQSEIMKSVLGISSTDIKFKGWGFYNG